MGTSRSDAMTRGHFAEARVLVSGAPRRTESTPNATRYELGCSAPLALPGLV
jgi:hypothetical protein